MAQGIDAQRLPGGQPFDRARGERNWLIFGLFKPKDGKVGKRPVSRSRPWITVGVQNAAKMTFDEVYEYVSAVQDKHIAKYNQKILEMIKDSDTEPREMVGVAVGYLARPGSAMVVCDLDDIVDENRELAEDGPWTELMSIYDGYAEVSSSGTGLRLLMPRQEGDEDLSSGSEIGGGCFVAKGEKGMALTFDVWKNFDTVKEDDFGAPEIVAEIVRRRDAAKAKRGRIGGAGEAADWSGVEDAQAAFDEWGYIDLDQLREIFEVVPNEDIGREEWIGLMLAIKEYYSAFGLEEEAWALFDDWTARREDGGYDYDSNRAAWDGGGARGAGSRTTMSSWLWRYHQVLSGSEGFDLEDDDPDSSGASGPTGEAEWSDCSGASGPEVDPGDPNWWSRLRMIPGDAGKKKPMVSLENAKIVGKFCPEMAGFVARGLDMSTLWRMRDWDTGKVLPRPVLWTDGADYAWAARFQSLIVDKRMPFIKWPISMFDRALKHIKDDLPVYDPIRREIDALPEWDGVERLSSWMIDYCAARDSRWARISGRKFLIGMIARGMGPGVKLDTALVLHGHQGIGKSTLCRILCGDEVLFTDRLSNVQEKDAAQEVGGKWIVEIGEGIAVRKSDREAVKMFLSAVEDNYRPPYGRNVVKQDRRCAFIMTTNDPESIVEEGRRFWPITIGKVDIDRLKADRGQLLAEAKVAFLAGEEWWLTDDESRLQIEAVKLHSAPHAWEEGLWAYLRDKEEVTIGEVMFSVDTIQMSITDPRARGLMSQIGSVMMNKWGWMKVRRRDDEGGRFYSYVRDPEVDSLPPFAKRKDNVVEMKKK